MPARAGAASRLPRRRAVIARPLRVLVANGTLAGRTGTETLTRAIAIGLLRRGHRPVVYAPELGPLAEELRAASIPVTDDLRTLTTAPDVIHAHHTPTAAIAATRFRARPVVFVAHDFRAWHDIPPVLPNIRRYLAVNEALVDRLTGACGIPAGRVGLLLNPVDTARFLPGPPLPPAPARALLIAKGVGTGPFEEACRRRDIALDVVGHGVGRVVDAPERLLLDYDLVFASGLTALEAMACGRATVVADPRGLAGMATLASLPWLRRHNLGLRALIHPLTAEALGAEIDRYDPQEAASLSVTVRGEADLGRYVDQLIEVYAAAMAEAEAEPVAPEAWDRAVSEHLQLWAPRLGPGWPWLQERQALLDRLSASETMIEALPPGEPRGFGAEDPPAFRRLIGGFDLPEPNGVWTLGEEAALLLNAGLPHGHGVRLEWRVAPILGPSETEREVEVIVNGVGRALWTFTGEEPSPRPAALDLPASAIGPGGLLWILFRVRVPRSPQELGLSEDGRRLGIRLEAVTLQPAGHAAGHAEGNATGAEAPQPSA